MTPAQIAATLAAIAKRQNLNQSTIAKTSGVPQGTISRVFSGKVAANIETLCKIADAVGARIKVNNLNAEKMKSIIISDNLCAISAALLGSSFAKEGDTHFSELSSEQEDVLISQGISLAEKRAANRSKENGIPLQFCREEEAFICLYGKL